MGYFANKRNLQEGKTMVSDASGRVKSVISGSSGYHLNEQKGTESDFPDEKTRGETECGDVESKSKKKTDDCCKCMVNSSWPVDFANPSDEMQTEKDFRMLQGMYLAAAKELLPLIEEECDRMEYEGSAMFDEYPDYTTIYTLQKRISEAAQKNDAAFGTGMEAAARDLPQESDAEASSRGEARKSERTEDFVSRGDLIRVMLLQEMHRRRCRHRSCADEKMF
ncbi:MAG: hypothetical protein LIP12_13640 [Clostridiales bacterium]|nr:hypothetical protein [Clostridiales bacterium]